MVALFKKLCITSYIITGVISLLWISLIVCFILINNDENAVGITFLIFIPVLFINAFIFNLIAINKHNKIVNTLNNKCDAIKFVNEYYPLVQRASSSSKKLRISVMLNLACGYIELCDFENAKQVLMSIDINRTANAAAKAKYNSVLAKIMINDNNLFAAQQTLTALKAIIDDEIKNPKQKALMLMEYDLLLAEFNFACQKYDCIESVLHKIYSQTDYMVEKANIQYLLGRLYLALGKTEDAKYSFRFAAENGNTLGIVEKSQAMLADISS